MTKWMHHLMYSLLIWKYSIMDVCLIVIDYFSKWIYVVPFQMKTMEWNCFSNKILMICYSRMVFINQCKTFQWNIRSCAYKFLLIIRSFPSRLNESNMFLNWSKQWKVVYANMCYTRMKQMKQLLFPWLVVVSIQQGHAFCILPLKKKPFGHDLQIANVLV